MAGRALYSVATWDSDLQAYTPQVGLTHSFNLTIAELRQAVRELRACGYSVHRKRALDGSYDDNDASVLIERTDGKSEADILESWWR